MAPFDSFQRLLKEYMKRTNAKNVLEFGPGLSTKVILSFPIVTLVTIEHNPEYYQKALKAFENDTRVAVVWFPDRDRYVNFVNELGLQFDLIFVDGNHEWRADCMKAAKAFLSPKGVLILHDSERDTYAAGRQEYRLIEESQGTAVFCLPHCYAHGGPCSE